MPPVNYDARSLVPDFEPAIRQLMGAYQQRQEQRQQDEALGLATDLAGVGGMDALLSPDNAPMLLRLNRMNPELFQTVGKIAMSRDQQQTQQLIDESEKAKNIYKAFLSFEEPAERSRYLAEKIREIEANGQDASKLRELIGKSPDQQRLYANARIVEAGDASMIGQASLDDLKKQMELQTEQLRQQQIAQGIQQTGLQMQLARAEEARKQVEAGQKQAEAADKQASAEEKLAAQRATIISDSERVRDTIGKAMPLVEGKLPWYLGSVAAAVSPGGDEKQLRRTLETLKANIGFDKLAAMRRDSPTGGALGNVTVQELARLENVLGNLDALQGADELSGALQQVLTFYDRINRQAGGSGLIEQAPGQQQAMNAPDAATERERRLADIKARYGRGR